MDGSSHRDVSSVGRMYSLCGASITIPVCLDIWGTVIMVVTVLSLACTFTSLVGIAFAKEICSTSNVEAVRQHTNGIKAILTNITDHETNINLNDLDEKTYEEYLQSFASSSCDKLQSCGTWFVEMVCLMYCLVKSIMLIAYLLRKVKKRVLEAWKKQNNAATEMKPLNARTQVDDV
jgi:hypothetical protein